MSACRYSLKEGAMRARYDECMAALAQDLADARVLATDAYKLSGAVA